MLYQCKDSYAKQLEQLALPVDAEKLESWHKQASTAAFRQFDNDKFGSEMVSMSGTLRTALQSAIDKEFRWRTTFLPIHGMINPHPHVGGSRQAPGAAS